MHSLLWVKISIIALLNLRLRKLFAIVINTFGFAVDLQGDGELRHNEKGEEGTKGSKLSPELTNELRSLALLELSTMALSTNHPMQYFTKKHIKPMCIILGL